MILPQSYPSSSSLRIALLACLMSIFSAVNLAAFNVNAVSSVSYGTALKDALRVASMSDNWEVMRGAGFSMNPFYNEDSIVIIDYSKYSALREGMMVVYTDHEGELVGHTIVRKSDAGWIAKGVNNGSEDPVLVTADNFVGTIFGVFNTSGLPKDAAELIAMGADKIDVVVGKKY